MRPPSINIKSRDLLPLVLHWALLILLSLSLRHGAHAASKTGGGVGCPDRSIQLGDLRLLEQESDGPSGKVCSIFVSTRKTEAPVGSILKEGSENFAAEFDQAILERSRSPFAPPPQQGKSKKKAIEGSKDCQDLAVDVTRRYAEGEELKSINESLLELISCEEKLSVARLQMERSSLPRVRQYSFNSDGRFEIYSQAEGSNASQSRTKVYYFFPRKKTIEVVGSNEQSIQVVMGYGGTIEFRSSGDIGVFPGLEEKSLKKINSSNGRFDGAVFLQGLILELPEKTGTQGARVAGAEATLRDASGRECRLAIDDLFGEGIENKQVPAIKDSGSAIFANFRFKSDRELREFVGPRCPALDLKAL